GEIGKKAVIVRGLCIENQEFKQAERAERQCERHERRQHKGTIEARREGGHHFFLVPHEWSPEPRNGPQCPFRCSPLIPKPRWPLQKFWVIQPNSVTAASGAE